MLLGEEHHDPGALDEVRGVQFRVQSIAESSHAPYGAVGDTECKVCTVSYRKSLTWIKGRKVRHEMNRTIPGWLPSGPPSVARSAGHGAGCKRSGLPKWKEPAWENRICLGGSSR